MMRRRCFGTLLGLPAMAVLGCDGLAAFANDDPAGRRVDVSALDSEEVALHPALRDCRKVELLEGVIKQRSLEDGECYVAPEDVLVLEELRLGQGTRVAFGPAATLEIGPDGRLLAEGTDAEPVILTGLSDTNGGWTGVYVSGGSAGSKLGHVELDGAGQGAPCCTAVAAAGLYLGEDAHVEITDPVLVRRSAGAGVYLEEGAVVEGLVDVSFSQNEDGDVRGWNVLDPGEREDDWVDLETAPGGDCESGDSSCSGQRVLGCVAGTFEVLKDCSQNVDSGTTQCVLYDGAARCSAPPPRTCQDVVTELQSGVPWTPLDERSDECEGSVTCKDSPLRTCMLVNMGSEAVDFSGTGSQWIGLVAYDEVAGGLLNRVSGLGLHLESDAEYSVAVYTQRLTHATWGLEFGGAPCGTAPLVEEPAEDLTAVWSSSSSRNSRETIVQIHVEHLGGTCAPWVLSLEPSPCPSFEGPAGSQCAAGGEE